MTVARQDEAKSRTFLIIKLAVVAVCLGGAAFFVLRPGQSEEQQLDTPESADPYVCLGCKHVFDLTPRSFEQLVKQGAVQGPGDGPGRPKVLTIRCPSCGQMQAVPARRCPKDGTVFPYRLADGTPGKCPKCGFQHFRR